MFYMLIKPLNMQGLNHVYAWFIPYLSPSLKLIAGITTNETSSFFILFYAPLCICLNKELCNI